MKTAALVIGFAGGVLGLFLTLVATAVESSTDQDLLLLSASAFACSVVALVGSDLTGDRPGWAAGLLFAAGIGMVISIATWGILPGALMLIGSLFAFGHYRRARQRPPRRAVPTH